MRRTLLHFENALLGQGVSDLSSCSSPIFSTSAHSSKTSPKNITTNEASRKEKLSKWAQFVESIDSASRDEDSTESDSEKRDSFLEVSRKKETDNVTLNTPENEKKDGFLDFLWKREKPLQRNASTLLIQMPNQKEILTQKSKSLVSSPSKAELCKKSPILKCFDVPKMVVSYADKISGKEKSLRLMNRRSSTPSTLKFLTQPSTIRESGVKTDSENDEGFLKIRLKKKLLNDPVVICDTPENIIITKTAPSIERFSISRSSSSVYENDFSEYRSVDLSGVKVSVQVRKRNIDRTQETT